MRARSMHRVYSEHKGRVRNRGPRARFDDRMVALLRHSWHAELGALIESAERSLTIATPYITQRGSTFVCRRLTPALRTTGRIELLTDLAPIHVSDGSLDPDAVIGLYESTDQRSLWHLPRFHAKVYIADECRAIVTSGNLTTNGLFQNTEYGVLISERETVAGIQEDFDDFRATGTHVSLDELRRYAEVAQHVRATADHHRKQADARLTHALESALQNAEDELIRLRLAGGALHTVFAKTIQFLLQKYGPLPTTRVHELVQALHPELCDDSVDRVIDGKRFGKKWKHAVRTAQQQLKRSGLVQYSGEKWEAKGWSQDR